MSELVRTSVINHIGHIELNRPQALNSLSLDMIRELTACLRAWEESTDVQAVTIYSSQERAFCAGGDIRFFYEAAKQTPQSGSALLEDFFTEEYALNHLIHHYPKPYLALMNGVIMGGGMGIAQAGPQSAIRVVTEKTKMAMPEVNIGLFPDVGGGYFLSRMPGNTGRYLGLTGEIISGQDAVDHGLADFMLPSENFPALFQWLNSCSAKDLKSGITEFIGNLAIPQQGQGQLKLSRQLIDHHFSGNSISEILQSLLGGDEPFCKTTAKTLLKRSPLMMCVTLEQLKRASTLSIAECLRLERTMVRHCFEQQEVVEGIRALVIDKDNLPQWRHKTVAEVSNAEIQYYFEPVWPDYAHPLHSLTDPV